MIKNKSITIYNKKKEYEEKVKPVIENLKKLCNELNLPFFATVCIANSKSGSVYESEMLSSYLNDVELEKDILPKFVNVLNGFDTISHQEIDEIEYN